MAATFAKADTDSDSALGTTRLDLGNLGTVGVN